MCVLFDKSKLNVISKVNLGKVGRGVTHIKTYCLNNNFVNKKINVNLITKPKRPKFEVLKNEKTPSKFTIYSCKYNFGFFSGCTSFSFRVTFKEYRQGLKASKFSLLLNQFNLNLDNFISIIDEILINNFSVDFYENLFGSNINDIDFKIHFFIILDKLERFTSSSKFFVIPKGCYVIHLRKILWYTLFFDIFYLKFISEYYNGFKKNLGLIFMLSTYYITKLIHYKITKLINKFKVYDYEERAFESIGNIINLNIDSFKLYCKSTTY